MKALSSIVNFRINSILLMFFCMSLTLFAQEDSTQVTTVTITDIPAVQYRIPSKEKIENFRNDSRFSYYQQNTNSPGIFNKFIFRLFEIYNRFMLGISNVTEMGIPGYIIIIVVIIVLALLVIKSIGINYKAIFGKKKLDTPDIEMYSEDVNTMNFSSLIQKAIESKNYRLATRFLYLRNLKLLADKEIIKWNINKTNASYQHEISNPALKTLFGQTSYIFDYVWYGDFPLSDMEFADVNKQMTDFAQIVANEE